MTKRLCLLLFAEFLLAFTVLYPGEINRRETGRAIVAYYKNPTAETQQKLDLQRRVNNRHRLWFSTTAFALMAGATVFGPRLWRNLIPKCRRWESERRKLYRQSVGK